MPDLSKTKIQLADFELKEDSQSLYKAIYEDYKVQLWVSEIDPDKMWVNMVENEHGTSV